MKLYDWSAVCDEVTRPIVEDLWGDVWKMASGTFTAVSSKEIIETGLYGHLYTSDIHVSSRLENEKPKLGPVV